MCRFSCMLLDCCLTALLFCSAGCQQEMADQPRTDPLEVSAAFPDGRASRHPVAGTVARGHLQIDEAYFTGREQGELIAQLPQRALENTTITKLLARGQNRYLVFCSQCHGQLGGGVGGDDELRELVGMVVQRGFPMPPTYHQPRLRDAPLGHFFDVIANGFGRMPAHGYMIPPQDRWAIAAYIRALQLSQHAERQQLAPADVQALDQQISEI
jgi:mono/diheme cytochrome c family protein